MSGSLKNKETKLDAMAQEAMKAIIASPWYRVAEQTPTGVPRQIAKHAYAIASAMMEESQLQQNKGNRQ